MTPKPEPTQHYADIKYNARLASQPYQGYFAFGGQELYTVGSMGVLLIPRGLIPDFVAKQRLWLDEVEKYADPHYFGGMSDGEEEVQADPRGEAAGAPGGQEAG